MDTSSSNLENYYIHLRKVGIDPLECKKYIGGTAKCLFEFEKGYPEHKIVNVFWSTPCGYDTLCWVLEGFPSPLIHGQVFDVTLPIN